MRNLITTPLSALALAAALLLAPAAPALAAPAAGVTAVKPGAFCKDVQLGQVGYSSDGDAYVCEKRNGERVGHWYGRHADTPAPKPTKTAATPAHPAKPANTPPAGLGKGGGAGTEDGSGNGTKLPVTGDATPYQVGGGLGLLAVGGGILALVRRRRSVRFTP